MRKYSSLIKDKGFNPGPSEDFDRVRDFLKTRIGKYNHEITEEPMQGKPVILPTEKLVPVQAKHGRRVVLEQACVDQQVRYN